MKETVPQKSRPTKPEEEFTLSFLGFKFTSKNPGKATRGLVIMILLFLLVIAILFTRATENISRSTGKSETAHKIWTYIKKIRSP